MSPRRRFSLALPQPFELGVVAKSHGWYSLPPFAWDEVREQLSVAFTLDERPVTLWLAQDGAQLRAELAVDAVAAGDVARARAVARWCLRLDEDLSGFYALARDDERLAWAEARGAGRILRSPEPFDDLIKVLCTTNCAWSNTKAMVERLVAVGPRAPDGRRAFPSAAALARRRETFFRDRIRAGYRAPHLRALARAVARGQLDLRSWCDPARSADEVRREILALPGIGPYAAAHLMRLAGRYDDHGIDSWCRTRFGEIHGAERGGTDTAIARHYARYGPWLGLALWLDLTRSWHVAEPARALS